MSAVRKTIENARNAFAALPVSAEHAFDAPHIVDAVRLLGNRAEFIRKYERELADKRKAFQKRNKDQWEKLRAVEAALCELKADEASEIVLGLISKVEAHLSALRWRWEATNTMLEGVIPAAISADRPEEWVRRALNYIVEPEVWAHDAGVEQLDFLRRLQARVASPSPIESAPDGEEPLHELDRDQFEYLQRMLDEKPSSNVELQRLMSTKPHREK